jgi:predicted acyl esterase
MTVTIRRLALAVATTFALCAATPVAAMAAPSITSHLNVGEDGRCPVYDNETRVCSGQVPSFDGAPLDVDLTTPRRDTGERHPLIVMLHGFGANKHEWQSTTDEGDGGDKYHWNSHWFAKQGYYVLTYTARGFDTGPPFAPYQPPTPSGTSRSAPNGTIRLKSREVEIRDTQYLSALVAAAYPDLDRDRVAVTGNSYGGGESWVQASQPTWTFPREHDPSLPILRLQVSVPKYGWTDLAYGLAPNGHGGGPSKADIYESSQGQPNSPTGDGNPIGVVKKSYVESFFAIGNSRGMFEQGQSTTQPNSEGPINIPEWKRRVADQGDPYDEAGVEDPTVKQARRGLTEYRSAYYQDEGWASEDAPAPSDAGWRKQAREDERKVAIFAVQGWTDDLFPAVESFRQYKYLKRLDPRWPVTVGVADIGHSRAQNKPETWRRLNAQAYQWLQSNIAGSHEQETTVFSEPTVCENDGDPDNNLTAADQLTATTPEGLARGTLAVRYTRPGATASQLGEEDPDGPRTDPVLPDSPGDSGACRQSETPESPGRYTAYSQPLSDASTYVGLGEVDVPYTVEGQTATFNARVWDVAPSGATTLMTRGTYRIDVPAHDSPTGTLRLPLFGNQWRLGVGHKIRLDLTQVDQPFLRPATPGAATSSVQFGPPELKLPIRESADRVVGGT